MHGQPVTTGLGLQIDPVAKPELFINARFRQFIFCGTALAILAMRDRVPLRRGRRKAHIAIRGNSLVVQNHLDAAHLLVAKNVVIRVVEQQHAQALGFQGIVRAHLKLSGATEDGAQENETNEMSGH